MQLEIFLKLLQTYSNYLQYVTHSNQLCGCVRKYPERLFVNVVVLGMLLIVSHWTKCTSNKEK